MTCKNLNNINILDYMGHRIEKRLKISRNFFLEGAIKRSKAY